MSGALIYECMNYKEPSQALNAEYSTRRSLIGSTSVQGIEETFYETVEPTLLRRWNDPSAGHPWTNLRLGTYMARLRNSGDRSREGFCSTPDCFFEDLTLTGCFRTKACAAEVTDYNDVLMGEDKTRSCAIARIVVVKSVGITEDDTNEAHGRKLMPVQFHADMPITDTVEVLLDARVGLERKMGVFGPAIGGGHPVYLEPDSQANFHFVIPVHDYMRTSPDGEVANPSRQTAPQYHAYVSLWEGAKDQPVPVVARWYIEAAWSGFYEIK